MKNVSEDRKPQSSTPPSPQKLQDHLSSHLASNPDSSYVTWVATLHPESADLVIDERFFVPNNIWWAVFEEAKAVPVATAIPVEEAKDQPPVNPDIETSSSPSTKNGSSFNQGNVPGYCHLCLPLAWILGHVFYIGALTSVFALELGTYILYLPSSLFFHAAEHMKKGPLVLTGFFVGIFVTVHYILVSVDALLLGVSVFLSELFAHICLVLCCLFCCQFQGQLWHQHIRRTCHILRWAFRKESTDSKNTPRYGLDCMCTRKTCHPEEDTSRYTAQEKSTDRQT